MKLQDKVAIVTGGARGIGLGVAIRMAEEGAHVLIADFNRQALDAASEAFVDRRLPVLVCEVDVSTPEGNAHLVQQALRAFGQIDIFHANAGVAPFKDLIDSTPAEIAATIDINLTGAVYGCSAVLPEMISRGSGVILLTASIAAFVGDPTVPVYSATKGGLTALCKSLAVRHGPQGIRCNTICPGDVRTPMLEKYLALNANPALAREQMIDRYALKRLGEPEDIGRLAVFLASEDAAWITGTDIIIDGGLMARCY